MHDHTPTRPGAAWSRWFLALCLLVIPLGCASGSYGPGIVAPSIPTSPASATVQKGDSAQFTVTTYGSGPMTFQWMKNGAAIPSATNANYTTPPTTLADTGAKFSVIVTNRAGSATSEEATLTVEAAPVILTQPVNKTVLFGTPATFSVQAEGSAPMAYQWYRDGAAISGATATSYTLASPQVATDNGAQFQVTVTNPKGNVTSSTATLRVVPAIIPLAISAQPVSQTATVGAATSLSVTADGTGTLVYQWAKDGADLAGATAATLAFPAIATGDQGSYTVKVSDDFGSITSSAATVTVVPMPVANPGFEDGFAQTAWTATDGSNKASWKKMIGDSTATSRLAPRTGAYYLYLGNISGVGSDYAYQDIAIPADATSATLTYAWALRQGNTSVVVGDVTFKVEIRDTSDTVLATAKTADAKTDGATVSPAPWKPLESVDLLPYKGQTVRIYFTSITTKSGSYAYIGVDDVAVQIVR